MRAWLAYTACGSRRNSAGYQVPSGGGRRGRLALVRAMTEPRSLVQR